MADEFVTMANWDLGPRVSPGVATFVVEKGVHPRVAASQCASFAQSYPSALKLRIMCHGYYRWIKKPSLVIGGVGFGGEKAPGYGLEFGDEVYFANLMPTIFSFVYNCFDAITLVACGAAGMSPKAIPWGEGDGKGLCRALAASANAPVWAADKEQASNNPFFKGGSRTLNPWNGNVYIFPADGGPPSLVIKG